jgi:hypothetical protein
MRLAPAFGVALAAWLCLILKPASAQDCADDGSKLLDSFSEAKTALATKGCTELDRFISARTLYADFLDGAAEKGCEEAYVAIGRLLVSGTYKKPPADCGVAWKTKGDNRQLQYDAIAVLNGDIVEDVFIDGDAIIAKQEFWHAGNHTVGLSMFRCRRQGADAAFARQCAEGKEASETATFSFDATQIDPQRIDVTPSSALTVLFGKTIATPEEFVKSQTRTGGTSDATSIVLHCLPDTQCVRAGSGVNMNLVKLYCDPEVNCNDVLSNIVEVIAMMRRPPH